MSELKAYRFLGRDEVWPDANLGSDYYLKSEADSYITELKAENERLKRALWIARALRARDIQRWWLSVTCATITERACNVWHNIERKCLEKAEEYK